MSAATRKAAGAKLDEALALAQAEMAPARKNAVNPEYGSTYADQAAVHEAVSAALTKHGIAYGSSVEHRDGTYWAVFTLRRSGEKLEFTNPICAKPEQGSHRFESASTQAQRVCMARACGVQIGTDDDGNAANGRGAQQRQQQGGRDHARGEADRQVVATANEALTRARAINNSVELRDYIASLPPLPEDHPAVRGMWRMLDQRLRTLDKQALAA